MKKIFFVFAFFYLVSLPAYSESEVKKELFSFDTEYLAKGLQNNGWGFGINYEIDVYHGIAVKVGLSHMTMWNKNPSLILTSVEVSSDVVYYPFNRGLDWLYFGGQCKTGFFMYNGSSIDETNSQDCVISLCPLLGWKHSFVDIVMVDVFCGYRFVVNPQDQKGIIKNHVKNAFEYGLKVKISLGNLLKLFKK